MIVTHGTFITVIAFSFITAGYDNCTDVTFAVLTMITNIRFGMIAHRVERQQVHLLPSLLLCYQYIG